MKEEARKVRAARGSGCKEQLKFSKSRDTLSTPSHKRPLLWWLRQARGVGPAQWATQGDAPCPEDRAPALQLPLSHTV